MRGNADKLATDVEAIMPGFSVNRVCRAATILSRNFTRAESKDVLFPNNSGASFATAVLKLGPSL